MGAYNLVQLYIKNNGTVLAADLSQMGGGASCLTLPNGTYVCFDLGAAGQYANIYIDVNGPRYPNTTEKRYFCINFCDATNFNIRPAVGYKSSWGPADGVCGKFRQRVMELAIPVHRKRTTMAVSADYC